MKILDRLLNKIKASRGNDFTVEEIRAAEQRVMKAFMETEHCPVCEMQEKKGIPTDHAGYGALAASQDEEDKAFHDAMHKRRENPKSGDKQVLKNGTRVIFNGYEWVAMGAVVRAVVRPTDRLTARERQQEIWRKDRQAYNIEDEQDEEM